MTPVDLILSKLFVPVNAERVQKAKAMCLRQKVDWQQVLNAMTPEQRQQVESV